MLCDRVGIMVNGHMEAIGSLPHLKSRFGCFWQIFVSANSEGGRTNEHLGELKELMRSLHPQAEMLESHLASSMWRVPNTGGLKLADAFRRLEDAKERLGICEYSVSQCSLEQIFMKFAKRQILEEHP